MSGLKIRLGMPFIGATMSPCEPTNSDLAAQIGAVQRHVQTLVLDTAKMCVERAERDALAAENSALRAELAKRDASPLVPLKCVDIGTCSYETARTWCEQGLVLAEKRRGRWFVDAERLRALVASRMGNSTGSECQRSLSPIIDIPRQGPLPNRAPA